MDQPDTPGIPRTRDGKPNLAAPAPRASDGKPDFSGMWIPRDELPCDARQRGVQCTELSLTPQILNIARSLKDGLPYQPWAADLVKKRADEVAYIDPHTHCMPPNFPRAWAFPETEKIFQTPTQLVILHEFNARLPSGLFRRSQTSRRYAANLERLLCRPLGKGYARGGIRGLSRRFLARHGR